MTASLKLANAWITGWLILLPAATEVLAQPGDDPIDVRRSRPYQGIRAVQAAPEKNLFRGSSICSGCHSGLGDFSPDVLNRVCLTEYKTWNQADRHADAYASLSSDRAASIGRLLRRDVFHTDTGCVQCHSLTAQLPAQPYDQAARQALLNDGIGCEACHGPSSNWLSEHSQFASWQAKSLDAKTDMGWIDVRSPVTRAEICISCHVGSAVHGRVITHDMYAAGHPPLAGFELESFADRMPRHWRYAHEKTNDANSSFQRTQNLLIAAVVSMRMAVELAAAEVAAPQQANRWPEFGRLDCFACHHELQSPGRRLVQHQVAMPGRPQLVVGCLPLVRVAATVADGAPSDEKLDAVEKQLQTPFESNPFGDRGKLAQESRSVVEWCRSVEQRLESLDLTLPQARDVLRQIAEQAAGEYRDYDSARQLLGAWLVVYGELDVRGELLLSDDQRRRVDGFLASIGQEYPQIVERRRINVVCGAEPPAKRDYNALLAQQYKNRIEYDPARFKELLTQLARSLPN